jgi:hypothetical protein
MVVEVLVVVAAAVMTVRSGTRVTTLVGKEVMAARVKA